MILIIDDDNAVRSSLGLLLKQAGRQAISADGPEAARKIIDDAIPELLILDMNFSVGTSGDEGLDFLRELKSDHPNIPVILITAWGSIPLAVEGMKAGASDFITKPWSNDGLLQSVNTALALSQQSLDGAVPSTDRAALDDLNDFDKIVGNDKALVTVLHTACRVCTTDASVLILGESGTGKELLAEAIHANSHRQNGPFVKVNLGGIPGTLFESEMFGHTRGAFTGAVHNRAGRFELADSGTIFLDEIGDLDLNCQVKLLRVLQEKSFETLGGSKTRTVDFRTISATNRDIEDMVIGGRFREDLFYRINLITLKIPPLRERRGDIPLLVRYFVENLKVIYRRDGLSVGAQAIQWLSDLPWIGNVRELKNLVERTAIISDHDNLEIDDFRRQTTVVGDKVGTGNLPAVGTVTIEEMEASMIKKALEFHGSNISKVARSLGLSRGALYRRMEKYGITV